MNDLITVEDYNSAVLTYTNPFEYKLDTLNLELDTTYQYDFVTVTKSYEGNRYKYEFKFYNDAWNNTYYLLTQDDRFAIPDSVTYEKVSNEHRLTIYSNKPNLKLILIIGEGSTSTVETVDCLVKLKNNVFFDNFSKRTYEFELINYDSKEMKSFDLIIYTVDNERIKLSPTRTEGGPHFKDKVIFEYTPTKLLKDEIEFVIHRGAEILGSAQEGD